MSTLHFECFAGISGDMTLGALVDLGVPPDALRGELVKLGLTGWSLEFARAGRCGICATQALVRETAPSGGHSHTHWSAIRSMIERAPLSAGAVSRALAAFGKLAEAEAAVHGVSVEDVAFHEVGAVDSIIDIVGSAICLDILNPSRVTASEVELGGGEARCAHGTLPVPAPATLRLCAGMPVRSGGFNVEMTTPTGAAILAANVDEFVSAARWREIKTGYGAGSRELDKPNVLRVSLREELEVPRSGSGGLCYTEEELYLLETTIDDMTGEGFGFLLESLFEAGALDVTLTPCVMKKSRPGTIVSALATPEKRAALRELIFRRSTTLGLREIPARRYALPREQSADGKVKTARLGAELRSKTEYAERARLAGERGIPLPS